MVARENVAIEIWGSYSFFFGQEIAFPNERNAKWNWMYLILQEPFLKLLKIKCKARELFQLNIFN